VFGNVHKIYLVGKVITVGVQLILHLINSISSLGLSWIHLIIACPPNSTDLSTDLFAGMSAGMSAELSAEMSAAMSADCPASLVSIL
jgi:hypothetical protein